MNILSMETSTSKFSLAVSRGDKIMASQNLKLKGVLSTSIIPSIERLLKRARMKFSEINCLAVGLGPGSFTSLRVGLSTVKGLSLTSGQKVVGIVSLDVLAFGAQQKTRDPVCAIMDAKRNMVYAAIYGWQDGRLNRTTDYFLIGVPDLMKKISQNTFFVGDGVGLYRKGIEESLSQGDGSGRIKAGFADESLWYPNAKILSQLALNRAVKHQFDDPDTLVPLYLYPDHCQVDHRPSAIKPQKAP